MLAEIKVGPPVITMNQGGTFMVTTEAGEIAPDAELGFFARDTRLVSSYRFFIQGKPWLLATSAALSYYGARYYFVSPRIDTPQGPVDERQLELRLERTVGGGVHEDFDIANYGKREVSFRFALAIESDFADIFEVKSHNIVPRGYIESAWNSEKCELVARYRNRDFERAIICRLHCMQTKPHFGNGRILFDITLPPGESWHTCCYLVPILDGTEQQTVYECHQAALGNTRLDRLQQLWKESATSIATPNQDVQRAFDQAISDMGALRLYEHDVDDGLWMPAAGVPWFMTIFGRDSLIASLQNMFVSCPLANATLTRLAAYQAAKHDDWRDAQPGKILHEIRFGELAHFKLIPHIPYYGTADATILFLILISEAYLWTGDERILQDHRDHALRCLDWIDKYGDLDGDGFQEYKTFSPQGYHNMGWKDSGDAVVYPDGSQVEQPIALCELQGYIYDAKRRMAEAFEILGDKAGAEQLRAEANKLKRHFNDVFWMEEEGCYAYALDPNKEPVRTIASNSGHLLWSGIVDSRDKAARVIRRLLAPDMFSGWGIRTLTKHNPLYNPHAYQLGSVWPHDNAFIAAGAKRFGLWQEANQIARAIFDACAAFQSYRLPELFAGIERTAGSFPVAYIGANIPQAWAAGSIFMLLQTMLGIAANAPEDTLYLQPTLPDWLPEITVKDLQVGRQKISIRFFGSGKDSSYEVLENKGKLRIGCTPAS